MAIGEIALLKMEFSLCEEPGEPRFFQLGVVVGIEIVNADNSAAIDEQTLRNVVADKAGRSSYENRFHAIHFLESLSQQDTKVRVPARYGLDKLQALHVEAGSRLAA
jgi:2-keto-3-deoxy-galactonokinase